MMVDAVCIDLDGTLLDTAPDLAAAANATLAELKLAALPDERISEFVGKGAEVLLQRTLAEAGVGWLPGEPEFERARAHFLANYRRNNGSQSRLFDGVAEGLEGLKGLGLRLACITNKPAEFISPLLLRFRLEHYFDFAIGGDSLPFRKPHPGQLLEACRRWALPPARVLAVGDSINDAQAARAAGMPVFLVPYGYNEGNSVYDTDADGIVRSLAELPSLIQGQNARPS